MPSHREETDKCLTHVHILASLCCRVAVQDVANWFQMDQIKSAWWCVVFNKECLPCKKNTLYTNAHWLTAIATQEEILCS